MPLYLLLAPTDEGVTPPLSAQLLDADGQPVSVEVVEALWHESSSLEPQVVVLEAHWTAERVARVAYFSNALPLPTPVRLEALASPATLDTAYHTVTPWGEIETTV